MLLGDMDDWYADVLENYRDAGVNVPTASTTPTTPAAGGQYLFDPLLVGSDVGQYYTAALSDQPGYTAILRNIAGIVAPDVKRQIAQTAAERGVGIGSYGGANDASGLLRALGLTSMDLTNKGLEQYQKAYSAVPTLAPTSLFVTPTDRARLAQELQLTMARLNQEARQAELDRQARERLARISQETAYGTTGAQLAASYYGLQASRLDRDAANQARLDQIAAANRPTTAPITGGGAQPDVWYSGTAPGVTPWWNIPSAEQGTGTGGIYYAGAALTPGEEEAVTEGWMTPGELGYGPEEYDYYAY